MMNSEQLKVNKSILKLLISQVLIWETSDIPSLNNKPISILNWVDWQLMEICIITIPFK